MSARYNNNNSSLLRNLDWTVVILYAVMVIIGAISIYAASYDYDDASIFSYSEFSGKQLLWIALSFVLGFSLLLIDKRMYETYAYPIYLAVLLLLFVTIFIAPDIKGSRSWIVLGPMSLQPAEFGKFATALALAKLFSGYNFVLNSSWKNYARALAIIFAPILLILMQNETGSALVYFALIFVLYREGMSGLVLFAGFLAIIIFVVTVKFTAVILSGIAVGEFAIFMLVMLIMVAMATAASKRLSVGRNLSLWFILTVLTMLILDWQGVNVPERPYLIGAVVVGACYCLYEYVNTRITRLLLPAAMALISISFMYSVDYVFNNVLQPHQQMRIKVTLGIEEDLLASGYNVNQSKIAIGSGGFSGKGFLQGTQTKLKYVPEQHTDFIFCTIGEEEGFLGSAAVILLFLMLILRIIAIAERQPTTFGRVYAYCVASYLILHLTINIGMVIGLCPVIGIPLPFFSYGGSSLWGFTVLLFIMLRIDASRRDSRNY